MAGARRYQLIFRNAWAAIHDIDADLPRCHASVRLQHYPRVSQRVVDKVLHAPGAGPGGESATMCCHPAPRNTALPMS